MGRGLRRRMGLGNRFDPVLEVHERVLVDSVRTNFVF